MVTTMARKHAWRTQAAWAKRRLNDGNNNGQLGIANATSGGARKAAWANKCSQEQSHQLRKHLCFSCWVSECERHKFLFTQVERLGQKFEISGGVKMGF